MNLVVQGRLGHLLNRVMVACTLHVSVIMCLMGLKGFVEELLNLPGQSASLWDHPGLEIRAERSRKALSVLSV